MPERVVLKREGSIPGRRSPGSSPHDPSCRGCAHVCMIRGNKSALHAAGCAINAAARCCVSCHYFRTVGISVRRCAHNSTHCGVTNATPAAVPALHASPCPLCRSTACVAAAMLLETAPPLSRIAALTASRTPSRPLPHPARSTKNDFPCTAQHSTARSMMGGPRFATGSFYTHTSG